MVRRLVSTRPPREMRGLHCDHVFLSCLPAFGLKTLTSPNERAGSLLREYDKRAEPQGVTGAPPSSPGPAPLLAN